MRIEHYIQEIERAVDDRARLEELLDEVESDRELNDGQRADARMRAHRFLGDMELLEEEAIEGDDPLYVDVKPPPPVTDERSDRAS